MGENLDKKSGDRLVDSICVLALEAPTKPGSSARPPQPRKKKILVADEPNNNGWRADYLIIGSGEDIGEKVLSFFQKSTTNSVSSPGRVRMGHIVSATGFILDPSVDTENSSASYQGSFPIMSLQGRYIISEDGQVQQQGPLIILSTNSFGRAFGGRVNGRLVAAAEQVQVLVGSFYTEDEQKV